MRLFLCALRYSHLTALPIYTFDVLDVSRRDTLIRQPTNSQQIKTLFAAEFRLRPVGRARPISSASLSWRNASQLCRSSPRLVLGRQKHPRRSWSPRLGSVPKAATCIHPPPTATSSICSDTASPSTWVRSAPSSRAVRPGPVRLRPTKRQRCLQEATAPTEVSLQLRACPRLRLCTLRVRGSARRTSDCSLCLRRRLSRCKVTSLGTLVFPAHRSLARPLPLCAPELHGAYKVDAAFIHTLGS